MLGEFSRGNGSARRKKARFYIILCKGTFDPIDLFGSLRDWPKFEGLSGVVADNNS